MVVAVVVIVVIGAILFCFFAHPSKPIFQSIVSFKITKYVVSFSGNDNPQNL